jgi:hypothetical protein
VSCATSPSRTGSLRPLPPPARRHAQQHCHRGPAVPRHVADGQPGLRAVRRRHVREWIKHEARVMLAGPPPPVGSILCMASISSIFSGLGPGDVPLLSVQVRHRQDRQGRRGRGLAPHGVCVNCISPYAVLTPMVVDQFSAMVPPCSWPPTTPRCQVRVWALVQIAISMVGLIEKNNIDHGNFLVPFLYM